MRKDWDTIKKFAAYSALDEVPTNFPKDPEYELDETALKHVFDEIFAVDPVTGFPRGDIQYYLSASGNPQVKQWLENNILKPRMSANSTMQGLSDDLIAEMSQRKSETIDEYSARIRGIYDDALRQMELAKQPQELKE